MKYFKQQIIIGLAFLCSQFIFSQTEWFTDDFETVVDFTTIDGKTIKQITPGYAVWYDGGSGAYQKDSEYMTGSSSYALANPAEDGSTVEEVIALLDEKPYYGSIYTEVLDLSGYESLLIDINYLFVNKNIDKLDDFFTGGNGSSADIFVQISSDGGETFRTVKVIDADSAHFIVGNKTLIQTERDACVGGCNILGEIPGIGGGGLDYLCATACNNSYNIEEVGGKHWGSTTVDLSAYISNMTVIRLKSGITFTDFVTLAHLDDITLRCDGCTFNEDTQPKFSKETIQPTSDPVTTGRTLYNTETFDDDFDWGIWEDGGRNAYSTEFLAKSVKGVCLRSFYSGKSNGLDPITNEDLGFQKPTYSSIVTKNLDFTEVNDLELNFSFVPYQMSIYDPSAAELAAAGNTNLLNEDEEEILGYVPGSDRVEISISTNSGIDYVLLKTLTYAEDFINKQRYDINLNIPGDITSSGALTTTTKIKIQCFSDTDSQQFYIDDLSLYTIGSSSSPEGNSINLAWEGYEQTVLNANASISTYEHINSTFITPEFFDTGNFLGNSPENDTADILEKPGLYGAVEHTDCDHEEFGEHITQINDTSLNKTVFAFNIHKDQDTDRCRTDGLYDDRQRLEIKTYNESYEYQKALEGETHYIAWKMKLPEGFDASDKFTHLHQIKPVGGVNVGMPTITLTANGPKIDLDTNTETAPAQLNLRYSPSTVSQVTVTSVPISDLEGKWIQFLEKVTYGTENEGRYELLIYNDGDIGGTPLLDFKSYSFETWKGGDFVRPKWGIYRSILQPDKIKDETVLFSDFVLLEVTDKSQGIYGNLEDFGTYVQNLASVVDTSCTATAPINLKVTNDTDSIKLTWNITTTNSSHHNVRYSVLGEDNWTKVQIKDDINTLELTNLIDDAIYEWQIRAVCDDDSGSNYLDATGIFTTNQASNKTASGKTSYEITKLYPNPAHNELNFKLKSLEDTASTIIKIYAFSGKEFNVNYNITNNIINIDTSKLKSGPYILKVIYKDSMDTMSFIKAE